MPPRSIVDRRPTRAQKSNKTVLVFSYDLNRACFFHCCAFTLPAVDGLIPPWPQGFPGAGCLNGQRHDDPVLNVNFNYEIDLYTMTKNHVLDTNVLLHDPTAIECFEDNNVIIPLKVIEEIDQFKREVSERGRNARTVARMLDNLRNRGRLSEGISLDSGGTLRVVIPENGETLGYKDNISADDIIVKTALQIQKTEPQMPCILVSKDINLRLKADALGLEAEDYENGHVVLSEMRTGIVEIKVDSETISLFKQDRRIESPDDDLVSNQYIIMRDQEDEKHYVLGRYNEKTDRIQALIAPSEEMDPIRPRNIEQQFALDALLDDSIKLVTLVGKAGTGKTLLAVAAGVFKVMEEKIYKKMLVSRPTLPLGKDLGYLPGSLEEKLDPWMQPIHDALDLISHGKRNVSQKKGKGGNDLGDAIAIEPLSYIRGRSIPNQFMIVDEAQNLTPLEVKTVITRVGHDTKIVLTGDIYQIDNPYVDSMSNGMNAVVERFRGKSIASHVLLSRGVRSEVAELAANLL